MSHVVAIQGSDGSRIEIDWHKIALDRGDEIDRLQATLQKIANMFDEVSVGAVVMKPNYGYYDVLKTARQGLKD